MIYNYFLIFIIFKLVYIEINYILWLYSYKIYYLIVCEMEIVDISFYVEISNFSGSLMKKIVEKLFKFLFVILFWVNYFLYLIFNFVSCYV